MTSILLLITCVVVTWLCFWVNDQDNGRQRRWSPFDIRDASPDPAPAPQDAPGSAIVRSPRSQPIRNHASERPWKRRSGF